ncbi:hypothetical protein Rsub_12910 [Raphidocelis subcapitata]|uniref:UspA domain-containing protein n=1 Tax=Raphidocelis subcapitata TaxID=307507 RepID=A0A2V0PJW0_9CHLO|nr:hypothetical protein Rsub_12910 [Raphidocelis subcapitata]|eukprot:GBG00089.1 hypothetical protein Rsub_12910 [Raphidocelis subcapitata]
MSAAREALLVAVDDSEASDRAFDFAARYVDRLNAELHLVHVVQRQLSMLAVEYDKILSSAEQMLLRRFISRLPAGDRPQPVVHIVKSEVDTESVGHILVKKAQQLDAIALVISAHGGGKLKQVFLGSVTKYVTEHARTPVVLVPPPNQR